MKNKKIEDEIKFLELLKNPLRLFGWLYPYFFAIILIIGIFYVKNLEKISFNTIPVSYIDSLKIDRDIPEKKGGIMPAVDLNMVKNPTAEIVAKGKELFDANCQSCHGAKGMGDGPAGLALNPKPRNFHNADGWTNGRTLFDIYKTLQEGIIKNGMAAYEYIPPADRIAIIHYIRTFADFPEITDDEVSMKLDLTYNLSAGTQVPNQIPVKKSLGLIKNEFNAKLQSEPIQNYIKSNRNSLGAQLLDSYSISTDRIIKSSLVSAFPSNLDDFVNSVCAAPIDRGFTSDVVNLSREDWQKIYNYLHGLSNLSNS